MSVSELSPTRALGSVSGLLQVVSLLGLVLLLLKVAQLYLRRQWLLKTLHQFPSPPPNWLCGYKQEGTMAIVLIYDSDYMNVVLGRSGTGLLLLEGQMLFQHWWMLTPAFHYDILKPYMGLMAHSVQRMLEELISQDSHVEIFRHVSLMTLDTIMKCTFSFQCSIQTDRNSKSYIQAVRDLNNAVIKERKAHLQKEGELEKVRSRRHLDFLDILLFTRMQKGSSLSDEDLHAEVDTFMFKGHDTTASGISWILYTLASYPVHQQRCQEEIQSLLVDGASITRNHPPLSFYGLHHNPKVWPNLEIDARSLTPSVLALVLSLQVFDPSRFAPGSTRHSHAFLPFSGGFRNFIGKQFSMNELKVAVALTLLRFELAPDPSRVPVPI
ncbi:hypothetical protein ABFV05_001974 [Capra hircus]